MKSRKLKKSKQQSRKQKFRMKGGGTNYIRGKYRVISTPRTRGYEYDKQQATWLNILDSAGFAKNILNDAADLSIPTSVDSTTNLLCINFGRISTEQQRVVIAALYSEIAGRTELDKELGDKGHAHFTDFLRTLLAELEILKPKSPETSININDPRSFGTGGGGVLKINLKYDGSNRPSARLSENLVQYQKDYDNVVDAYYRDVNAGTPNPGMAELKILQTKIVEDKKTRPVSPIPFQGPQQKSIFGLLHQTSSSSSSSDDEQYDTQDDGGAEYKEQ